MDDFHYKGRAEGVRLSVSYAVTTGLANEAVIRHDCDPVGAHLFGRALTAGLLATSTLHPEERINLRWGYKGRVETLLVDAGPDGSARGLIAPAQPGDEGGAEDLLGPDGEVRVIRSRDGKVVTTGTVAACYLDPVEDLSHFLCMSDQVESAMLVLIGLSNDPGRPVALCRGLLLQAQPGCDLEAFNRWRERLKDHATRDLMARAEEPDSHLENLLHHVLDRSDSGLHYQVEAMGEPRFSCGCSREKMGAVLRSLPYGERMEIVKKKEPVVVTCHFCRTRYELDIDDCIAAWNEKV